MKTTVNQQQPETSDRLLVHIGNALLDIAATYPYIIGVILESVQNALDSNAKNVGVRVNQKAGTITVRDDGDGASIDKFKKALNSVCHSIKAKGKLGRFGRGLISPLGKCVRFTFTSSPKGKSDFNEWTFTSKDIEGCESWPDIPRRPRTDLTHNQNSAGRGVTFVGWNTEVMLTGVTSDSRIGRINMNELVENILAKFNRVLTKLDATVNVSIVSEDGEEKSKEVKSSTCTGEPLEMIVIGRPGEKTEFTLFRALKKSGLRRGKVLVGEHGDDFRIPMSELSDSLRDMVSTDAVSALVSGIFEGDIVSELVKLHPSRTRFEDDEGLLKFCLALADWFERYGKEYVAEAEEKKEDQLYQDLGLASLRYIEDLIMGGNKAFDELRKVIESFKIGNVGTGHKKPAKENVVGHTEEPVLAAGTSTERESTGGEGGARKPPKVEHEEHHPFTAAGPRGRVRQLVKSGSTGLQFQWVEMPESEALWDFDVKLGVLSFNTRSAAWLMCKDNGPKHIRQFQEMIAIEALTVETMPDSWKEGARAQSEEAAKSFACLITESDAFKARMQPV